MNALALAAIDTFKDQILHCDAETLLRSLPAGSVDCIVTSPPYYALRDYGTPDQLGLEELHDCHAWATGKRPCTRCYVCAMRKVFAECYRVLKGSGVMFLNLGDSYTTHNDGGKNYAHNGYAPSVATKEGIAIKKPSTTLREKNLYGIPWRVALALQADGWILRSDIIWAKPNPMPESVKDRPTKAHEYIFLFSKSQRYFYNQDAIAEKSGDWDFGQSKRIQRLLATGGALSGGTGNGVSKSEKRNKRTVWEISTQPFPDAHFAVFPPALIEPMIKAGCPENGIVVDPFSGSGTTALVARQQNKHYIGCDLNPEYVEMARARLRNADPYQQSVIEGGGESKEVFTQASLFQEVQN